MSLRRRTLLGLGTSALLTACFTTSADFQRDAERFIDSEVAEVREVDFVTVECEEPRTQDVDEHFGCTAVDSNGGEWEFDVVITDEREFTVNLAREP
jgi:hypothetical protein